MLLGDRVKVFGLVNSPHHNDLEGEISETDDDFAMISVILDGGETLKVNRKNLLLLESARSIFGSNEVSIPHILPKHLAKKLKFPVLNNSDGWKLRSGSGQSRNSMICCRLIDDRHEHSTPKTYGCFGYSSSHYVNRSTSTSSFMSVFDISQFFPSSMLAEAVLKDPVANDYYSERYSALMVLSETDRQHLHEALAKAPQTKELKLKSGEFQIGDNCKIFESTPSLSRWSAFIRGQTYDVAKNDEFVVCILFTVGPIFNKLYVYARSPSDCQAVLRECSIRLAQKKVRMLNRWISRVQPKVNTLSRDWIRGLETRLLEQGVQMPEPSAEQESDLLTCLGKVRDTDVRWSRCTPEEAAAASRLLVPVNRIRMCMPDYSLEHFWGKRTAYQSLLASHRLPDQDCVEVTPKERILAHIRASASLQAFAAASPEEAHGIIERSIQALDLGHSSDSLSRGERLEIFGELSPLCPGVAAVLKARKAARDALDSLRVLDEDGAEFVTKVASRPRAVLTDTHGIAHVCGSCSVHLQIKP
jgi:hypothetical protein